MEDTQPTPEAEPPPSSPPSQTPAPVRGRASSGAPWSLVVVALSLAVVSLAVAAGALLVKPEPEPAADTEPARRAALKAASERTLALTSYDFRRLDQDFAGVLATATGQFAEDYQKTSGQLRATFTEAEAVATSQVAAVGLESFQPDRAVAVVAVDQVIRTKGAVPRTELNRIRMTLVKPEDIWLVERVERL